MTHAHAVEQKMVERYLLGELTGEKRDQFEDHLFDCLECAADLKQGVLFLDAARQELKVGQRAVPVLPKPVQRSAGTLSFIRTPWAMAAALAACLAIIVYQSAIAIPRLKAEAGVQMAQAPELLQPLVLANAGARGGSTVAITAPRHGFYLLSVDIPPSLGASRYRCSLYSPAGVPVWHVDVSPEQAKDAVMIQVPVMTGSEGMNELHVQAIPAAAADGGTLVDLTTYRYQVKLAR